MTKPFAGEDLWDALNSVVGLTRRRRSGNDGLRLQQYPQFNARVLGKNLCITFLALTLFFLFGYLVAEDNVVNQRIAVRLLSRFGLKVDVVANGQQACDVLSNKSAHYDLCFMDVQMPGMSLYLVKRISSPYLIYK